jgi:uncharacterized protein YjiS (DUF1127 family)
MEARMIPQTPVRRAWDALPGFAPLFGGRLRSLLRWLLERDTLYRERMALEELDDRTLRDIGVSREELAATLAAPDTHLALIRRRNAFQEF